MGKGACSIYWMKFTSSSWNWSKGKLDLLNVYVLRKQHENMVEAATCSLTRDKELKEC